jgi:Ca2+-binding EF-hand superfamily protein
MRMTAIAAMVSTLLIGAAAQAGDYGKMTKEQFTAADKDRDGALTLAEAQAGAPKIAEKFSSLDTNSDGKLSAAEFDAHADKSMEADQPTTPSSNQ